ncbi:MAG: DNA polymerase II [Candidatus Nanoarchaeia archaeon]|nr:DNA polymerase II [Candidatus Nanoarchaeia archaeon]
MVKKWLKGIITDVSYEVVGDSPLINVFGRLQDGRSFKYFEKFNPYFFIKENDVEKANKILKTDIEKTSFKNFEGEPVVKINVSLPKDVPFLKNLFADENISCYESDIPFTRRYLIDKGIQSTIEICGVENEDGFVDVFFEDFQIKYLKHDEVKNNLEILSIDIETDPNAKEIYAVSFYGKNVSKVFVVKNDAFVKAKIKDCFLFESEKELLEEFYSEVKKIDPDIITGWNLIDFDLKIILEISKKYKIPFKLGRDNSESNLRIESSFLKDSKGHAKGRSILDGIHLMKISFVDLDDYKLNTAAKEILGESKVNTADDRTKFIQDSYRKDPEIFFKYNLKDSQLVYDILIRSNVFDLTVQRSLLTGMSMDSVSASIASFDSIYLPKLHEEGFVANSVFVNEDVEQGLGGFVMKSKPGIYSNLLVLDFKSLYPSLIRTFGIDPFDFVVNDEKLSYSVGVGREGLKNIGKYGDEKKYVISPNGTVFKSDHGILPNLIGALWKEREIARKNKNELARAGIKLLMNSMYGVLASPKSRFFNRFVSNSITYFAQFFIQTVINKVESEGYEVIYGDTDSIFVNSKLKDTVKAVELGRKIEKDVNLFLKEYISKNYSRESVLEIEFEKTFVRFFMPTIRGKEEGAKKRYAGLKLLDDRSTVLDFTGLEFVRKDWTEVSKEFQLKLLDLVFHDKSVDEFIFKFVKDLEKGKYDSMLVYKKSLSKPLDSYTKTTPPHVKAARMLDKVESRVIEYLMTEDGPQPIQMIKSKIDYKHYIDKQIKPIADSVLQVFGKDFEDIMKGHKQSGLGKFF